MLADHQPSQTPHQLPIYPCTKYGPFGLKSQDESGSIVLPTCHKGAPPYAQSMSFGERLAAARKDAGLTQQELGRGLGTDGADASKSVVYGWEKDQHHPRVDQLILICERLGVSADYLLFGTHPDFTPEALSVAKWFDKLTDQRDRAVAETGAMGVILRVLQQQHLPPTDRQEHDVQPQTQPEPSSTPSPPDPPKPAKSHTKSPARSGHKD